ncbi:MAG: ribonuclease E inhibitor RraB [Actinomycetota bacterium]|nr:ribonuclease E inhibitor RraB [Actinomycetota bacterium]
MAEWYEQLLEEQLSRNRDIWAELREHGLHGDDELRLGFIYLAAGEAEAEQLAAFLLEETDYEVSARTRPGDDDNDAAPSWLVIGTTQPTPVSLELLDDWCEWMIAAGAAEGPCAFDGWAAQLVGDESG